MSDFNSSSSATYGSGTYATLAAPILDSAWQTMPPVPTPSASWQVVGDPFATTTMTGSASTSTNYDPTSSREFSTIDRPSKSLSINTPFTSSPSHLRQDLTSAETTLNDAHPLSAFLPGQEISACSKNMDKGDSTAADRAKGKLGDDASREQDAHFGDSKESATKRARKKESSSHGVGGGVGGAIRGIVHKLHPLKKAGGDGYNADEGPEIPSWREMYERDILPHAKKAQGNRSNEGNGGVVGTEEVLKAVREAKARGEGPRGKPM